MVYFSARGTCNKCGRYSTATGADEQDAKLLLANDHGAEHGHAFEGAITVIRMDDKHSQR